MRSRCARIRTSSTCITTVEARLEPHDSQPGRRSTVPSPQTPAEGPLRLKRPDLGPISDTCRAGDSPPDRQSHKIWGAMKQGVEGCRQTDGNRRGDGRGDADESFSNAREARPLRSGLRARCLRHRRGGQHLRPAQPLYHRARQTGPDELIHRGASGPMKRLETARAS